MKFGPLVPATFLRRYKRFLVDVRLADGTELTVHCPNTGSMRGCFTSECEVLLSRSDNPKRKYSHSLEMTRPGNNWVGVHTGRTNALVKEALLAGVIAELGEIDSLRAEVKVSEKSRLDFLIENGKGKTFLEVKNCSLVEGELALFPDAVTTRGTKHLHELMELCRHGDGAAVLFCVQREEAAAFAPAWEIDPVYSAALCEAKRVGVTILAYQADMGRDGITIKRSLPVLLECDRKQ